MFVCRNGRTSSRRSSSCRSCDIPTPSSMWAVTWKNTRHGWVGEECRLLQLCWDWRLMLQCHIVVINCPHSNKEQQSSLFLVVYKYQMRKEEVQVLGGIKGRRRWTVVNVGFRKEERRKSIHDVKMVETNETRKELKNGTSRKCVEKGGKRCKDGS